MLVKATISNGFSSVSNKLFISKVKKVEERYGAKELLLNYLKSTTDT